MTAEFKPGRQNIFSKQWNGHPSEVSIPEMIENIIFIDGRTKEREAALVLCLTFYTNIRIRQSCLQDVYSRVSRNKKRFD